MNNQIIDPRDLEFLDEACDFLADPGMVAKGLNLIGKPFEKASLLLSNKTKALISKATQKAIQKALLAAVSTLSDEKTEITNAEFNSRKSSWLHRGSTILTGAFSGFFGIAALPLELPVTTVLIMRGILDQAKIFGHDPQDAEIQLECLLVFGLGTQGIKDDQMESAYFSTRVLHAEAIKQATQFVAGSSAKQLFEMIEKGASPALVRFIIQIAKVFEVRVTQKMLGEMVPIAGALGGAALNYAFTDFYCTAAKYHFGIRALEKKYGNEKIQTYMKTKIWPRQAKAADEVSG